MFDRLQLVPKSYRPWTPTQSYLLTLSPLEWLPKDHLAYFVLDLLTQLDLSAIEGQIADKGGSELPTLLGAGLGQRRARVGVRLSRGGRV